MSDHILVGGPLVDEGGAMLIVRAESPEEIQRRLDADPWYRHGILKLESIRRGEMFVDHRS